LKILLDAIFAPDRFRSEIVWKRSSAHSDTKQGRKIHGHIHDIIFFYTKGKEWTWNDLFTPYDDEYIERDYRLIDTDGRRFRRGDLTAARPGGDVEYDWRVRRSIGSKERWEADLQEEYKSPKEDWEYKAVRPYNGRYWAYSKANMRQFAIEGRLRHTFDGMPEYKRFLDEMPGVPLQDLWTDIPPIIAGTQERLGYPTQKPVALLERIISASSNEGDLVLDPFCGCGTTVHAAQKLGRRWIGIDVTHLAIGLVKRRLVDAFPQAQFEIQGVPKDAGAARELAHADPHQFQLWALSMIEAQPYKGGKKGADTGIDGFLYFKPDGKTTEKAIVEVKSGGSPQWVRALGQVVERERAKIGVLVMMEDPTTTMKREADAAGFYESPMHGKFARLQILTVEDIFDGKKPHMPWIDPSVFKKARRESTEKQTSLDL
jgi:hypothetical protein